MHELSTLPSRRLKTISLAVRSLFWLVLSAWLIFTLGWIALHQVIVPRIGEFRPRMEAEAARILGVPVQIGTVEAVSDGLMPTVTLRDVVLLDPQGRQALRLPQVRVVLSPRALLNRGFEQLHVDSPVLDVRRTAAGRILVAGLDIAGSGNDGSTSDAADWFFSQTEFVIRNGSLRWTDELRTAPPLVLEQVDLVVRNALRRHQVRLDATPPPAWGQRFSVRGAFTQPLLSARNDQWRSWRGEVYADFPQVDVSQLRRHADLGLDIQAGRGAVRAWIDVADATITGGVADLALDEVEARLGHGLQPLDMQSVLGRLGGKRRPGGFELFTSGLQFRTGDGLQWPGGNVAVKYQDATASSVARGEFRGDRLDLAALADIGRRLPLGTATHAALTAYAPQGLVEVVEAEWQGSLPELRALKASGKLTGLQLAAGDVPPQGAAAHPSPGRPGLAGARIEFDLTERTGTARLQMDDGWLDFPGVFEEARIPVAQLSAELGWRIAGDRIEAEVGRLRFANADAEGEARIRWHTADGAGAARFPGVLDLQGSLGRADGARVYRYLPQTIAKPVRDYVRDAVQKGRASGVKFTVRGNLLDVPFRNPAQGEFRIAANLQDVVYDYVPPSLPSRDGSRWPALTQLAGELVFHRTGMEVNKGSARFAGAPGIELRDIDATIADLAHSTVVVSTNARGPAGELVGLIKTSPLNGMTGQALARASAGGNADYKLRLALPLANIQESRVQGSVTLAGNELQISPDTPALSRLQGVLNFSETGFSVPSAQARMLGGDIRFEGGMAPPAGRAGAEGTIAFRGQGTASAEGLRQATSLGPLARLAQNFEGSAGYSLVLGFRRGRPEITVTSTLQGLGSNLPAPLNKTAAAALPLRFQNTLVADSLAAGQTLQDQLVLDLGRQLSVLYVRDVSGAEPRVLRGGITAGVGADESPALADGAVVANIQADTIAVAAWEKVLGSVAGSDADAATGSGYLPTVLAVRAGALLVEGYRLNNVVVGGSRDGGVWRANVEAAELNGYVEYRASAGRGPGRLFARLARLSIAPSAASGVEQILDRQPESIPAFDIVVDDFELRGRRLGRVEVDAVNRGPGAVAREGGVREWRLNKLNVTLPEATLTASGNWAAVDAQPAAPGGPAPARTPAERRQTVMSFRLDVADSGALLQRFGMPGVIRRGKGKLEGQVAWTGSPLALDYPTLGGMFNVAMESGQFLKAEPGLAKLLGVLSLQALPRRLALDFRDVFSEGFSFDFVRGDVRIAKGVATTNNLQMKGVNAAVLMEGQADIDQETQDISVVVVPEINAGTASLVAAVINPAVGIGTFLAQVFLRQPFIEAATQEFHIDGSWADPRITKVARKAVRPDNGASP